MTVNSFLRYTQLIMHRMAWLLAALRLASAAALEALPEFGRPDPFGGVVAVDGRPAFAREATLAGARGGYVSCHLVVKLPETGAYALSVEIAAPLQAELFREWYHEVKGTYYPDALVPAALPHAGRIPDPDNRIARQTAQGFWLDIWIPAGAAPGLHKGRATLEAAGARHTLPITVRVTAATVPAEDAVAIDHNSYGANWLPQQDLFGQIHAYHRLFYEHRGVFHQLGYGHAGGVSPEFAPALEGTGRSKRVADWRLFDRHYGPLADGSAFAGTRRGPRPIPFAYLPVTPEWPASFLWWGEPGYEAEFVGVMSEFERHFREKGWVNTRFELFFNHKKRYKGFPWDGDETRFTEDLPYFAEYARLMRKAVPADSPVRFVFRTDASWMMEREFKDLAGIINFWVCGGTELAWYKPAVAEVKARGDIVWSYGGTPEITKPSVEMTLAPLRAWMQGIDGYVHWLAVGAGRDPWFHSDGGATVLAYPGARFGVQGPLPCVRLKLQRNAVQDINLLHAARAARDEVGRRYNGTREADWWTPRPPVADTPPHEWTNASIAEAPRPNQRFFERLEPDAWTRVRQLALEAK